MRTVPLVYALRTWSSLNQWKPRYTYITMVTYLLGTNHVSAILPSPPLFSSSPYPPSPLSWLSLPPLFPPCTQYNFDGVGYLTMEPVTLVSYICSCWLKVNTHSFSNTLYRALHYSNPIWSAQNSPCLASFPGPVFFMQLKAAWAWEWGYTVPCTPVKDGRAVTNTVLL